MAMLFFLGVTVVGVSLVEVAASVESLLAEGWGIFLDPMLSMDQWMIIFWLIPLNIYLNTNFLPLFLCFCQCLVGVLLLPSSEDSDPLH